MPRKTEKANLEAKKESGILNSYRVKLGLMAMLVGLLPWFYLPIGFDFYDSAKYLLLASIIFSFLLICARDTYLTKKVSFQRTPFDKQIMLLLGVYALSSIFSISSSTSIWGHYGSISGSLVAVVLLVLLFYVFVNNHFSKKNILRLVAVWSASVTLLAVFLLLQYLGVLNPLWTELNKVSGYFVYSNAFLPVGGSANLVLLFTVTVPLLLALLYKIDKGRAHVLSLAITVAAILVGIAGAVSVARAVSFTLPAFLLGVVGAAMLYRYRNHLKKYGFNVLAIVAFILISVFAFVLPGVQSFLNLPPVNAEPQVDVRTSWEITTKSLTNNGLRTLLFGAGPQTFSVAFSNFKPIEFNNNDFWNLRFNSSAQEIFNIVQATGLLGLTALVWLIGSVTRVVVTETRLLRKESVRSRYELVAIGATLIFVFLLLFVIPFQALGWITLFLLLAMFVASYYHLYPKEQGLNSIVLSSFSETDKKKGTAFVAKLAALSIVLIVVAFAWMFARRYSADIELRQSLGYLQSGNLQEAIRHAQLATTYAPDQAYIQRNLAIISVRYADLIATSETDEANIDQTLQLVEGLIRQSVYSIQTAVTLNPFDVESQESAAQIYATIFNFTNNTRYGNETLASLRNSITVEPFNPNHFVNLGLFLYRNGKTSEAEVALRNAYNLRPDYSASVLTLGSILEEKEDKTEAEDLYNAVLAFPNISEDSEFGKELRRRLTTLGDNTLGGSSSESTIQEQVIPSEESNLELE